MFSRLTHSQVFTDHVKEYVFESAPCSTCKKLSDLSGRNELTAVHDNDVLAGLLDFDEHVTGDNYRATRLRVSLHDLAHRFDLRWIKSVGGFVEHE